MSLQSIIQDRENARNSRSDGYTANSPVFAFQAEIEALENCDYAALRAVLALARRREYEGMTLSDLRAEYRARAAK